MTGRPPRPQRRKGPPPLPSRSGGDDVVGRPVPQRSPKNRAPQRKRGPRPTPPVRAKQRAVEGQQPVQTKDMVLEEALNDVIEIALQNGMTRDDVNAVLYRMVDKLAERYRSKLKVHRPKVT